MNHRAVAACREAYYPTEQPRRKSNGWRTIAILMGLGIVAYALAPTAVEYLDRPSGHPPTPSPEPG